MALGSSSFGTILQASQDNFFVNNTNADNTQAVAAATPVIPVETAGSIAWGGFDVCELSTTTTVDYSAYTSAPVETAGSIASAPIGSFASVNASTVSSAPVSVATSTSSVSVSSCSFSC